MSAADRLRLFGAIAALDILILDQVSKYWVLEVFDLPARHSVAVLPGLNLTMVWNRGVTFGLLGADGPLGALLLAAVAMAVVVALAVWLWRAERLSVALALGAVAGGAVGNIIDRLRFGAVVDFIHAHAYGWSWYVFNVADAAIVCGVGVLLLDSLLTGRRAPAPPPAAP
jgi:signal peptidase II